MQKLCVEEANHCCTEAKRITDTLPCRIIIRFRRKWCLFSLDDWISIPLLPTTHGHIHRVLNYLTTCISTFHVSVALYIFQGTKYDTEKNFSNLLVALSAGWIRPFRIDSFHRALVDLDIPTYWRHTNLTRAHGRHSVTMPFDAYLSVYSEFHSTVRTLDDKIGQSLVMQTAEIYQPAPDFRLCYSNHIIKFETMVRNKLEGRASI